MLPNVDVAVTVARHLLGPLDLLLLCVLDLLDLLDVLLDFLVHVKQVELVDVRCVEGVLCLQLLRVLQVNGLVILLVAALPAAFPLFLRMASGDQAASSVSVRERALGHQLGPSAFLMALAVAADAALLEPAAADFNDRLRPLSTVGAVDDDVILIEWLLVRGRLHAVLMLQIRGIGLSARSRRMTADRSHLLLLLGRRVLVEQLERSGATRHLRARRATYEQVDALSSQILVVVRLLIARAQGVELHAVVLHKFGDSIRAQLVDLGVRALVAQLLPRLVASCRYGACRRCGHQPTLLDARVGAAEIRHVLEELTVA